MSVLSVAKTAGAGGPSDSSAVQSTDSRSTETLDIAERLTVALEDFLDGLIPTDYRIELDWNTLAPLVSTLSAAATITLALTR